MFAGLRKLVKGALFDSKGTLSLSRCVLLFVVIEVTAITWLAVAWVAYVTRTGQMEQGAPLAQAVFTGVAAILSAQVASAAWQYFTQARFMGGGIAGRQLDVDQARTEIAAADAGMGMSSPPGLVPVVPSSIVPDSQSEPRVAAESQSSTVALTTDEPIEVEIVEGEK